MLSNKLKNVFKKGKNIKKDVTTHTFNDGSIVTIKTGLKKKGTVLKMEIQYDKDFTEDDVSINITAGSDSIDIFNPTKTRAFNMNISATKRF